MREGAKKKPYFPLFVDLSEKDILFVGGGSIAARRILVLQPFAGEITVVAPDADERIAALAGGEKTEALIADARTAEAPEGENVEELPEGGAITWIRRAFEEKDLGGRDMVFAVTDDRELNAKIAAMCREKGIAVNVSSDKSLCDFYFPGIVQQGETVIGVSASGKDHAKARTVRERIQTILTDAGSEEADSDSSEIE